LKRKRKKSAVGTNGINGTRTMPILINQIDGEVPYKIDVIRGNGYKGQNFNPNHQANRNASVKGSHCKKPSHTFEKRLPRTKSFMFQEGQIFSDQWKKHMHTQTNNFDCKHLEIADSCFTNGRIL
jgi:hypothetical protein